MPYFIFLLEYKKMVIIMISLSKKVKQYFYNTYGDILNTIKKIRNSMTEKFIQSQTDTILVNGTKTNGSINSAFDSTCMNNLPPKIGLKKEKTLSMQVHSIYVSHHLGGDSKFSIQINSQYVYIGGISCYLEKQIVKLISSDVYLYLYKNTNNQLQIEQYTHMLGGKDKDIHFNRIYIGHIMVDSVAETMNFDLNNIDNY